MKKSYKIIKSPVKELILIADEKNLLAVTWGEDHMDLREMSQQKKGHPILDRAETQLNEYFAGKRKKFELPLHYEGTSFQHQVWSALREIPFGETWSYKKLAEFVKKPKAVRAVGAANGKNPLSIVIPCHRVIGMNGKLVGFGGGLGNKEILLNLESPLFSQADRF